MADENKKYISEYITLKRGHIEITEADFTTAKLDFVKILPSFSSDTPVACPTGSNFLYEDYSPCLHEGETFYEIQRLEVTGMSIRQKLGTTIVNKFIEAEQPNSIVIRAGILYQSLYEYLEKQGAVQEYINKNIVPFWESLGFVNVNHTTFEFENSVPMVWSKLKAAAVIKYAEEHRIN